MPCTTKSSRRKTIKGLKRISIFFSFTLAQKNPRSPINDSKTKSICFGKSSRLVAYGKKKRGKKNTIRNTTALGIKREEENPCFINNLHANYPQLSYCSPNAFLCECYLLLVSTSFAFSGLRRSFLPFSCCRNRLNRLSQFFAWLIRNAFWQNGFRIGGCPN